MNEDLVKLDEVLEETNTPTETLTTDPKAVETAELEKAAAPTEKPPIEAATEGFRRHFPRFEMCVERLGNKSLRRLLLALMAQPLEDYSINLKRTEEKFAYSLGEAIFQYKMAIILHTLYENQVEIEKLKEDGVKDETPSPGIDLQEQA